MEKTEAGLLKTFISKRYYIIMTLVLRITDYNTTVPDATEICFVVVPEVVSPYFKVLTVSAETTWFDHTGV